MKSWILAFGGRPHFKMMRRFFLRGRFGETHRVSLAEGALRILLIIGFLGLTTIPWELRAAMLRDVSINEVAWMGTTASFNDEWLELKNNTSSDISLAGWVLKTTDGSPLVNLTGLIPASGFFLLERTADTTISDIPANQIFTGALNNTGENLTLLDNLGGTIDSANFSSGWPAGDNTAKKSMERKDPLTDGNSASNWQTNNGVTINGKDSANNPIKGTPKSQNSASGSFPPGNIQDLSARKGVGSGEVNLIWTATGDDGTVGQASSYEVRFATFTIFIENISRWDEATPYIQSWAPKPSGQQELHTVSGLSNTNFSFAVRAKDSAGNLSPAPFTSPFAVPQEADAVLINEIAPSQSGGADVIELFVAKAAHLAGARLYENANAQGSEQVKSFPTSGDWASPIPAGTFILVRFSSGAADDTAIGGDALITLYTTDSGLTATDNILFLSNPEGISFSAGAYQSGAIADFLAYADQNTTELLSKYQTGVTQAVTQGQWSKISSTPLQFDCANSRGLDASGKGLARNNTSTDADAKSDWSYRTSLTLGAANGASTTAPGFGSGSISSSTFPTVGDLEIPGTSTGNLTINYVAANPNSDNVGHMVTLDIPSGWTAPQTANPSGAGYTTTTFAFSSGFALSTVGQKIILPVGNLANGTTVFIQYKNATAQPNQGIATFLLSSDEVGTNAGALSVGSPSVQVKDITLPTVSITFPASGATVRSTITVTADASDDGGIAGVRLAEIPGADVAEDTVAPYAFVWNTTLVTDGAHTLRAIARDTGGNLTISSGVIVNVDNTPPVISAVATSNIAASSATVTWTTNEFSDSQVEYGTATFTPNGTQILNPVFTALDPALTTSHIQILAGLSSDTLYFYRARSKDAVGNLAKSGIFTFSTPDITAPNAVLNLAATAQGETSILLTWTAPGDSGTIGTAASYTIRFSSVGIIDTQAKFDAAQNVSNPPAPSGSGDLQSFSLGGLAPCVTYFFALKSQDEAQNTSALSNSPSATTTDITPPTITITNPPHNSTINTQLPLITITYSDACGLNLASLQVKVNSADRSAFFTRTISSAFWQVDGANCLLNGQNTITANIKDNTGHIAFATSTIIVSATPPPVTSSSSFVNGQVFNASANNAPLSGAEITLIDCVGTIFTDAQGKYRFPTPTSGNFVLQVRKADFTTVQRFVERASTGRDVSVSDAYLVAVDAQITTINNTTGGTVTDSTGLISLIIPSNSMSLPEAQIRLTRVTQECATPAIPPPGLFLEGIEFEPEGLTFNPPATHRIPNTLNLPVGTTIPYALYNKITNRYDSMPIGGQVVQVGTSTFIDFPIGHFSHCIYSAGTGRNGNIGPGGSENGGHEDPNGGCPVGGSAISNKSGNLNLDHALPSYRSLGQSRQLTLFYNSASALPSAVIDTSLNNPSQFQTPARTQATLDIEGIQKRFTFSGTSGITSYRYFFDGKNGQGTGLPTGSYRYRITFENQFSQGNILSGSTFGGPGGTDTGVPIPVGSFVRFPGIVEDRITLNNQINSPFGAGVTLSGLSRLFFDPENRITLTEGGGASFLFEPKAVTTSSYTSALSGPVDAAFDSQGNLFITAFDGPAGQGVYKLSPSGALTLLANVGIEGNTPVLPDNSGNVWIINFEVEHVFSETFLHHSLVKVTPDGSVILIERLKDPRGGFLPGKAVSIQGSGSLDKDRFGDIYWVTTGGVRQYPSSASGLTDGKVLPLPSGRVGAIDAQDNIYIADGDRIFKSNLGGTSNLFATLDAQVVDIALDPDGSFWVTTAGSLRHLAPDGRQEQSLGFGSAGGIGISKDGRFLALANTNGNQVHRVVLDKEWKSDGDFTRLVKTEGGGFSRILKDGTTINYNSSGLQTSIIDRNSNLTTYVYDSQSRLTSITDPQGKVTSLAYNPSTGKLTSITDPQGRITNFTHDSSGNLTSITNTDGSLRTFSYADAANHLITSQIKENGASFSYTYNSQAPGRIASATNPLGALQFTPEAVLALMNGFSQSSCHQAALLPAAHVSSTTLIAAFTDSQGNVTQYRLDKYGNPISVVDPVEDLFAIKDPLGRITRILRDGDGNAATITSPNGLITANIYDERGNILTARQVNIGNLITTFTYDPVFNQVLTIDGPRTDVSDITTFSYDSKGNPTLSTDALQNATTSQYDLKGRLTQTKDALGNITTFEYDDAGGGTGNLLRTTDPLGRKTKLTYDSKGNVLTSTLAEGTTFQQITTFVYDENNNLRSVTDSLSPPGITQYTYTVGGCASCGGTGSQLKTVTDARGKITTFNYDSLNHLTSIVNPLGQIKTFSYDSEGNLTSQTDPKGQTLSFIYDAAGQLTTKTLLPSTTNQEIVSFSYDSVGNMLSTQDADSRLEFTYDFGSRQIRENVIGGGTFVQHGVEIEKGYDEASNRLALHARQLSPNPAAGQVAMNLSYSHDALSRLTNLTFQDNGMGQLPILQAARYVYDALSRRTSLILGNGTTATYAYNSASELLSLIHRKSDGSEIAKSLYAYDPLGNRTNLTNPSGTHDFGYDALNRLTRAVHPLTPPQPNESFSYDSVGNRTSSHLATAQAHDPANRLTEDSVFTYRYDLNGNLTQKQRKQESITEPERFDFLYDAENRLVRAETYETLLLPTLLVRESYRYDALGRRIEINSNGTIRRYIHDGEDIVLELNDTGFPTDKRIHGPGIDEPILITKDQNQDTSFAEDERFYYHADGLGSIVKMTNPSASVVNEYHYDTFGNIISQIETVPQPYKFTAREFDSFTGKYHYRAREYDPFTGRFHQEDPLGPAGDINLYQYAVGNPVISDDPFGASAVPIPFPFYPLPPPALVAIGVGFIAIGIGVYLYEQYNDRVSLSEQNKNCPVGKEQANRPTEPKPPVKDARWDPQRKRWEDNDWVYKNDKRPHQKRGGGPHWDRGHKRDGRQEWSPDGRTWYPK